MKRRNVLALALAALVAGCGDNQSTPTESSTAPDFASQSTNGTIGINVVLKGPATSAQLTQLGTYGTVLDQIVEINGVHMRAKSSQLPAIRALPFVAAAGPDAERNARPVNPVGVTDFGTGINTWDLDAVNVTQFGSTARQVAFDGSGVYVGILDTGLLPTWRNYFPAVRIATQYAKSFGGGGNEQGHVSEQPNKWEQDTHSHGTHVTSTVIGYQMPTRQVNGVAPKATIIPVKVLNQNGSGWSSVIAHGIVYVANLKAQLNAPVVINMSLGGPELDPLEQAAIDFAVARGVIIVAAAGNEGDAGMSFPGAYAPVISAAATGWVGQWSCGGAFNTTWWRLCDVPDPTNANDFFITDFSSRQKAGQDLDVAAPGNWVVGPFQTNNGPISFFFVSGTSMATAHVAGIVALMLQKNHTLTASQAETILENSAIPLPAGSRTVTEVTGGPVTYTWGSDATGHGLATADAALAATN